MAQTGDSHTVKDISYQIWVGTIVTVVPATIAVALRFVSRHIAKAGLWWDDWMIVVSLIVNWAMAITRWMQVLKFNFGKHGNDLSTHDIVEYQKSFMAIQLTYFINAVLTKSSLLLLYQRIFGIVKGFHWALWTSWFLITAYFVACVIASILGCLPPSYTWTRFEADPPPGSCFNEIAFFRWNGIANMALDILMLILPLPMVWRMKTTTRQKVFLSGIFLMGGFVCVVSLLRIISLSSSDRSDPTYTQIPSSAWSSVEQGIGIVCACLPTLRPLRRLCGDRFRQGSEKVNTSHTESGSTENRSPGGLALGRVASRLGEDDGGGDDDEDGRGGHAPVGLYANRTRTLYGSVDGSPDIQIGNDDGEREVLDV